jgi:hypothetical protein
MKTRFTITIDFTCDENDATYIGNEAGLAFCATAEELGATDTVIQRVNPLDE